MSYLDIRIQELMNETEEHLLRSSQPLGWRGLVRSMVKGRLGWTVWTNWVLQVIVIIGAVYAAIEFYNATDVLSAVKYGLTGAVLVVLAAMFKLSMTPHIQTERVLRALKRVEILILAQREQK